MSLNGVAFANLPGLAELWLRGNVCIDKSFSSDSMPDKFRRKVSRNCATDDFARKQISCKPNVICRSDSTVYFNITTSCCYVKDATIIDVSSDSFVDDESYRDLGVMVIEKQKHIEFLPVMLHETFPHLLGYVVKSTPIRTIAKKNFEKLYGLEVLWMEGGQVETIRSNTFEDLTSLRILIIRKKPKYIFDDLELHSVFSQYAID